MSMVQRVQMGHCHFLVSWKKVSRQVKPEWARQCSYVREFQKEDCIRPRKIHEVGRKCLGRNREQTCNHLVEPISGATGIILVKGRFLHSGYSTNICSVFFDSLLHILRMQLVHTVCILFISFVGSLPVFASSWWELICPEIGKGRRIKLRACVCVRVRALTIWPRRGHGRNSSLLSSQSQNFPECSQFHL